MCQPYTVYSNSATSSTVYFVLLTSFHSQCQDGEARVRLPILSPQWLVSIRTISSWDWAWTSDWAGKQTPPSHHLLYALVSHLHSPECELPSGHAGLTTVQGDKLFDCHALDRLLLLESGALVVIHGGTGSGQALGPRVEQLIMEDWYRWLLRGKGKPLVSEA